MQPGKTGCLNYLDMFYLISDSVQFTLMKCHKIFRLQIRSQGASQEAALSNIHCFIVSEVSLGFLTFYLKSTTKAVIE